MANLPPMVHHLCRYFIFLDQLLNVRNLSDYRTVRLLGCRTIGLSDYRSDPQFSDLLQLVNTNEQGSETC